MGITKNCLLILTHYKYLLTFYIRIDINYNIKKY